MIFDAVRSRCKLPEDTTINLSSPTVLYKIENEDTWVPTGDYLKTCDPQLLNKVKFLEYHNYRDRLGKAAGCFVERHCLVEDGLYWPYMLKIYRDNSVKAEIVLFIKHIEQLKEAYFDGVQREHQNLAEHYLQCQATHSPYRKYDSDIHQFIHNNSPVIDGITLNNEDAFWYFEDHLVEFISHLDNVHQHRYADIPLLSLIRPSITGWHDIDQTTGIYITDPISMGHIRLHTTGSPPIIVGQPEKVIIDPDVPCDYNVNLIPDTCLYRIYRTLFETSMTDFSVKCSGGQTEIEYIYTRYPTKTAKKSFYKVIHYLLQLLNNEMRRTCSHPVDVRVIRTFDDEAIFQFYNEGKLVNQWYWDLSLSALCSNSLIVWPGG